MKVQLKATFIYNTLKKKKLHKETFYIFNGILMPGPSFYMAYSG